HITHCVNTSSRIFGAITRTTAATTKLAHIQMYGDHNTLNVKTISFYSLLYNFTPRTTNQQHNNPQHTTHTHTHTHPHTHQHTHTHTQTGRQIIFTHNPSLPCCSA